MSELADIAAARLMGVPRYSPGKPPAGHASGKLSSNEASLGIGPVVARAVSESVAGLSLYPSESAVVEVAATAFGVTAEQVLLTNGSDELCYLIATVFLGPDKTVVLGDPCYAIDATVSVLSGATLTRVPLVNGAHDLDAMAAAAQSADVVWLPSPHNPTGVAADPQALEHMLAAIPQRCLVVLDLAYADFADDEYQLDIAALLARHPHVVVQRTLSKSYALAGLRVGVALGSPDLIEALRSVRAPFSVNAVGLAATQAALSDPAWRAMSIARVREQRARLELELDALGVEYLPSQANFVLVHIDHTTIAPALERRGITVRDGADLGVPGWTRVTVGWAPMMADLRLALRETVQSHEHTTEGAT